jgi:predicted alternative tryptophan synthase beta-subunit
MKDLVVNEAATAILSCWCLENTVTRMFGDRVQVTPAELEEAGQTVMQSGPHDPQTVGVAMGYFLVARLYHERMVPSPLDVRERT